MKVNIRQEVPSDYAEVYELVKISFATTTHPDETVAGYLNEVKTKDTFIPELSLVADDNNGKIVGQVVLYETDILTPMGKKNYARSSAPASTASNQSKYNKLDSEVFIS